MKPRYDQDPSYQAFVNRYANDIVAFVEEILQVDVSPLMANALQHYFKPGARTLLKSLLHGATVRPLAPYALHRLLFASSGTNLSPERRETFVACPGNKLRVGDDYRVLAKRAIDSSPWLAPYLRMNGESIYLDDKWSGSAIRFRSAQKAFPEGLCGTWGPGLCWLVEDAHNMPAVCFDVVRASLGDPTTSLILSGESGRDVATTTASQPWVLVEVDGHAMAQSPSKSC